MSTAATTISTISRWLNYLLAIPMISLGLAGAILTVIIFLQQRSFHRNPTITYLLAGAIMTAIHLPSIYLQSILVDGFGLGMYNSNDTACRERNYLFYVTTVAAISFPCWAAFDQYVSTSRQAAVRHRWRSMRMVRLAIIGTVIFWGVVYFPLLFVSSSVSGVCVLADGVYTIFHRFILSPLVFIVGPITLITGFTLGTIRNLRATNLVNRHDRLAKQVRRMLIPQLLILAIFGIPFGIDSLYEDITRNVQKDDLRKAIENLAAGIARLIYHVIFVSTFYIYLYMSRDVRKSLKGLMRKYWRTNDITPTRISAERPITLQTLKSSYQSGQ